ncbi:hypothetical protein [Elizabethkingia miricola]|uniref:hypothetical protein n=1 Tax=Elizabethkingia miricola TaxID=172045 RepID=UPI00099AC69C|nr:hypothetical protein [Elizabethkingia miricola]
MNKKNDIRIYSSENFLVIEDFILRIKINYQAIESIIIYHVGETYNNQINIYLTDPVIYEQIKNTWWAGLLFKLFLRTNQEKFILEQSYSDEILLTIINEINENLPNIFIPNDLQNSIFWRVTDKGYSIPFFKLVYSKNTLGLYDTLIKYGKFKNE